MVKTYLICQQITWEHKLQIANLADFLYPDFNSYVTHHIFY